MQSTRSAVWLVLVIAAGAAGCGDSPPGRTFYQRNIEPILIQKCAGNTSGCHATNSDDPFQFAAGNFDVTSFENVQKRRDLLDPFGAYTYPLLLIKAVPPGALKLNYNAAFTDLQVQHSGGAILDVNSDAFFTLQNWLTNGATENGLTPATPPQVGVGACSTLIPADFKPPTLTPAISASLDLFKSKVQPVLTKHGCNAASCHGAPQSDFYTTCGTADDQVLFNFTQVWSFVNTPVDDSQVLRVPLAVSAGGRGHTGGDQFATTADPDYVALKDWATQAGKLDFVNGDPNKQFFSDNIQPMLLLRGCQFEACHSPEATNDFKLRTGTQGFFSAVALEKNYDLLRNDFMALEFPDVRRGRAMSKTILAASGGIAHRGGPVIEAAGAPSSAGCAGNPGTPFCTFQAWLDKERATLLTAGKVTDMTAGQSVPIVYVERPPASTLNDRLGFDTFEGGADLLVTTATFGAGSALQPAAEGTSLLGNCPGLTAGTADVGPPDVAYDGDHVVFAARNAASEPLGVFMARISDKACVRLTPAAPDANGLKIHNFDPVFSPDGNWVVFASTRGKPGVGPTRSRKRFLPQSDIWRVKIDLAGMSADQASYAQITVLSNSEVGPHFMREGRLTMTTEKTSDGFYQLSGRRINWDLTDYHPLLGQRAESPYADLAKLSDTKPSFGYSSVTDIREGSDGNFLLILTDVAAADGKPAVVGGGALAIFNRSVGPFEQDRTDTAYLKSLRVLDAANATGHAGAKAAYRAPVSLPDGQIMVSYADAAASGNFDIVAISPQTGARTPMFTGGAGGKARVDAVLAYKYPPRPLYENRRQLVFGGASDGADTAHAVIHMPDAPMLFTLLTGNLRRGRPVDAFRKAKFLAVYSEGLCPASGCTAGANGIFESRQLIGTAPLDDDGSVRVRLPAQTGVVLELQDDKHNSVVKMGEEHQLGPGEHVSMGVSETLFDAVCAGCHGSVSGKEIDVGVTPDALTNASESKSADKTPAAIGN
ncbi:MAG TPA: hypothetical protein VFP84_02780 [Kofleriaceae bacterium]|nr:hypothetical protein [Kofleriaceae bacterium]